MFLIDAVAILAGRDEPAPNRSQRARFILLTHFDAVIAAQCRS